MILPFRRASGRLKLARPYIPIIFTKRFGGSVTAPGRTPEMAVIFMARAVMVAVRKGARVGSIACLNWEVGKDQI